MAVALFDFIDALFDKKKYKEMKTQDKNSNFFMVQRFLSIRYPIEASQLNLISINKERVMDFWHMYLTQKYTRKPSWLYTKVNPSKKKEKDIFDKIKSETIQYYMERFELDPRDFNTLKQIFPQELLEDLKIIQSNL